jgi:hypothetical protein
MVETTPDPTQEQLDRLEQNKQTYARNVEAEKGNAYIAGAEAVKFQKSEFENERTENYMQASQVSDKYVSAFMESYQASRGIQDSTLDPDTQNAVLKGLTGETSQSLTERIAASEGVSVDFLTSKFSGQQAQERIGGYFEGGLLRGIDLDETKPMLDRIGADQYLNTGAIASDPSRGAYLVRATDDAKGLSNQLPAAYRAPSRTD